MTRHRISKFHNVPLRCMQGVMHQSSLEARRCNELHLLQRAGEIRDLEAHPQPRFKLDVNGVHVCDYLCDFRYHDNKRGCEIVEDTKGFYTEVSRLKVRLMLAIYGIEVEIVRPRKAGWR